MFDILKLDSLRENEGFCKDGMVWDDERVGGLLSEVVLS